MVHTTGKERVLCMANTRSTRNTHVIGKTSSNRKAQQRKVRRLFQSDLLTALFGRSVGTVITSSVLLVATVGLVAILAVGLLTPYAAPVASSSTSSTSGAPIGDRT